MNRTNILAIAALPLSLVSVTASAVSPGNYVAISGFSKTLSVTETEQLGYFRVILINNDPVIKRKRHVEIKGVIKGLLNPDYSLNHTFVDKKRNGVIYTAGDSITQIYAGDPYCSDNVTPFEVQQTLTIVAGTGKFSNVQPGSTIVVTGTINNCPNLSKYGHNNFVVTGGAVIFQ